MPATLLELVNEVLRRTGQVEVSTLINARTPGAQTVDFMNDVYSEMLQKLKADRLQKQASLDTENGTTAYTLASDAEVNSLVSDSLQETASQSKLKHVDYTYPLQHGPDNTGQPDSFYTQGDSVYFYPVPDGAYTIAYQYFIKPSVLANDAQNTELPEAWEKVLILGTQARLEKFLGESNAEGTYYLYREALVQLRARSQNKPRHRMHGPYQGSGN